MSTKTRDAIVSHYNELGLEKFLTIDEIVAKLKTERDSTGASMASLAKRAVLVRRMRDGSNAYEYAVGKRFNVAMKYSGRKFPYHQKPKSEGVAVPASAGGVGIVLKVDGQAHAITLAQAKAIYTELKVLFG